ncbi:unnamed protein product, partial [marine sediment metagenome]
KTITYATSCRNNVWQYGMKRIASDFLSHRDEAETDENRPNPALHRFLLYCVG